MKFDKVIKGLNATPYAPKDFETTVDAEYYAQQMENAINKRDEDALQVDLVTPEMAEEILADGGKLYIAKDGSAGAYVKGDGYMGGLFKDPTVGKNRATSVIFDLLRKDGGRFFDAYATHLEDIYTRNGFRPIARLDFDEQYAPKNWEKSNLISKPDVVFFHDDPHGEYNIGDGDRIDDYMEGYAITKNWGDRNRPW